MDPEAAQARAAAGEARARPWGWRSRRRRSGVRGRLRLRHPFGGSGPRARVESQERPRWVCRPPTCFGKLSRPGAEPLSRGRSLRGPRSQLGPAGRTGGGASLRLPLVPQSLTPVSPWRRPQTGRVLRGELGLARLCLESGKLTFLSYSLPEHSSTIYSGPKPEPGRRSHLLPSFSHPRRIHHRCLLYTSTFPLLNSAPSKFNQRSSLPWTTSSSARLVPCILS